MTAIATRGILLRLLAFALLCAVARPMLLGRAPRKLAPLGFARAAARRAAGRGAGRGAPLQMVFSGIVEEMGRVSSLVESDALTLWDGSVGSGTELTIEDAKVALDGASLGCSIAVNGVCLTATKFDAAAGTFTVGLGPDTLRRTNLGELTGGAPVNLERSLPADGRNSGHYVQARRVAPFLSPRHCRSVVVSSLCRSVVVSPNENNALSVGRSVVVSPGPR